MTIQFKQTWSKPSVLLAASVALSACDSGSDPATPSNVQEGVFIDSAVSGLHYQTDTQSGLTDENGTFKFLEGETIVFSIGDTELGRAQGSAQLTPFDITGHKALDTEVEILNSLNLSTPVNSYERSINIAALLQALDQDANPDNGIDLGNAHAALSQQALSIHQKALRFIDSDDLRTAQNIAGIDTTRTFSAVVNHLYSSLNIDIASSKTARQSDIFGQGSQQTLSFEYDSDGVLQTINIDTNGDGNIDGSKTFGYDANGNIDSIYDSLSDTNESLRYNEANQITQRITTNQSGNISDESFEYTDQGQLSAFQLDQSGASSSASYQYDANGHLTNIQRDHDGDSVTDSSVELTVTNNRISEYLEDSDDNGEANLSIAYVYDNQGNLTTQNIKANEGDTEFSTNRFEYDANNNPVRFERDDNQDGVPEYVESYKYNAANQRIQYRRDLEADGVWDFTAQYYYDLNGNRIRMIEDSNGDGIVDKVWESGFEAAVLDDSWDRIIELL